MLQDVALNATTNLPSVIFLKNHTAEAHPLFLAKVGVLCKVQINSLIISNFQRTLPFPVKANPILYPLTVHDTRSPSHVLLAAHLSCTSDSLLADLWCDFS